MSWLPGFQGLADGWLRVNDKRDTQGRRRLGNVASWPSLLSACLHSDGRRTASKMIDMQATHWDNDKQEPGKKNRVNSYKTCERGWLSIIPAAYELLSFNHSQFFLLSIGCFALEFASLFLFFAGRHNVRHGTASLAKILNLKIRKLWSSFVSFHFCAQS